PKGERARVRGESMPEKRHRFPPELLHRSRELRHPLTPAEQKLWTLLRNRNLVAYKFRRQHLIGHFIVDFYCAQVKLVIEIDGDIHTRQVEYDAARTAWLEGEGYTVIRFQNVDVFKDVAAVAGEILNVCQEKEASGEQHG
ncbi:MAG TPA: DUF559 domain-containing protein, partial [Anaerolineales bacterium]|nr:DUF559 domain-containing protein [Anaerolineales bacterium]